MQSGSRRCAGVPASLINRIAKDKTAMRQIASTNTAAVDEAYHHYRHCHLSLVAAPRKNSVFLILVVFLTR